MQTGPRAGRAGISGSGHQAALEEENRRLTGVSGEDDVSDPGGVGRGSQYTSWDYRARLAQAGITVSMSRKGDCYDNAMMESFFSTFKAECIEGRIYQSRSQARQAILSIWKRFTIGNDCIPRWSIKVQRSLSNRILELPSSLGPRKRVKTKLVSRETKEVSVTLDPNATSRPFSYWDVRTNGWEIASGDYRVYVGASSRDIRLTGSLQVHPAEKKEVR